MSKQAERIETELAILQCRRGDSAGYEALVRLRERRLLYYLRRLVGSEEDALDLLQEVWLKTFRNIRKLRNAEALPAWLYRVAHNLAVSHLRKQRQHNAFDEEAPTAPVEDGMNIQFRAEEASRIHEGLMHLPLGQREALTLFFLEGFSVAETAEVLDIPPGTVKSRLYHGKQKLRALLDKEAVQ